MPSGQRTKTKMKAKDREVTLAIKKGVGEKIREARDEKGYSRAAFGDMLGISAKTIQSWEMGRTFVERLDLVLAIEETLDMRFGEVLEEVLDKYRGGFTPKKVAKKIAKKPGRKRK